MKAQVHKKIYDFIEKNHMLDSGSHVIMGISGGADSMCLLFVMCELRERLNLKLTAVHVHHGLRGFEADHDEMFVQTACERLNVAYCCFHADIHQMAKEKRMTEEEAGRQFRYACFERVRIENNAQKIAVAHHLNDQAETVLFNLFRGSHLKGIGGIAPIRDTIIRPLLCLERSEIESILEEKNIDYCTDVTNFDTMYTRNKIRIDLLPYISEHINSRVAAHIAEVADAAREAYSFIRRQAEAALLTVIDSENRINIIRFTVLDPVLQKEILRLWIASETGMLKDITSEHILTILSLTQKSDGKCMHLPYGLIVLRHSDWLCLKNRYQISEKKNMKVKALQNEPEMADTSIEVNVPGVYRIPDSTYSVTFTVVDAKGNERFPENNCTKWLDYDKIRFGLKLRHRLKGDFMTIAPQGRHKLLRRVMIDDKIPVEQRDKIWLLADGAQIVWLPGSRISEDYKITENTKNILIVTLKEKEHGRQNQGIII